MNQQSSRTLQQVNTTMPAAEVLTAAKRFFARRNNIYSAFLEKEGPTYVSMRGQGGEEVIVGVAPVEGGTSVSGSTYLFDQQVARFLSTLPPLDVVVPEQVAATDATPLTTPAGNAA